MSDANVFMSNYDSLCEELPLVNERLIQFLVANGEASNIEITKEFVLFCSTYLEHAFTFEQAHRNFIKYHKQGLIKALINE